MIIINLILFICEYMCTSDEDTKHIIDRSPSKKRKKDVETRVSFLSFENASKTDYNNSSNHEEIWSWISDEVESKLMSGTNEEINFEDVDSRFLDVFESKEDDENAGKTLNHGNKSISQRGEFDIAENVAHSVSSTQINLKTDYHHILNKEELKRLQTIICEVKFQKKREIKTDLALSIIVNHTCIIFSEFFVILCFKIKTEEDHEIIKDFYGSFFDEVYRHKIDMRDHAKKIEIRRKIIELLRKNPDFYNDRISLYEQLVILEELIYDEKIKNKVIPYFFYGIKYISRLYVIIFLLNDEEVKKFALQLIKLRQNIGSVSQKGSNFDINFEEISTKRLFYNIYEIKKIYLSLLENLKGKNYEIFLKEFEDYFNQIDTYLERNPSFKLSSFKLLEVLEVFENYKSIFRGCPFNENKRKLKSFLKKIKKN